MKKTNLKIFIDGVLKNNPVLVLALGTCPTLAVTTSAVNGLGMGVSSTIVLICSNLVISMIKNIIPNSIRIPAFITVIAGFVTIVQMFVKAFFPSIDSALGIFLPLIVVNCIILARAEMFASKNSPVKSMIDGAGMGVGFTVALFAIGSIREIVGFGSWLGVEILPQQDGVYSIVEPFFIFATPAGGFFVFGIVMAIMGAILKKRGRKVVSGCAGCPSQKACAQMKTSDENLNN